MSLSIFKNQTKLKQMIFLTAKEWDFIKTEDNKIITWAFDNINLEKIPRIKLR